MRCPILAVGLLAAGCSTATDLAYTPAQSPVSGNRPAISAVSVTDAREEKDPTYIGAVRGGFGNPLKTVTTKRPIAQEVQGAFETALRARNLWGGPGQDTLAIRLTKLSANQLARRDAKAAFDLELRDGSGRPAYTDSEDVETVNGSLITFDAGVFASTDDLLKVMNQALTEAIDKALDKPGFLAAVQPR